MLAGWPQPLCPADTHAAPAEEPVPEAPAEEEPPAPPAEEPAAVPEEPVAEQAEPEAVPPTQEEPGGRGAVARQSQPARMWEG